MGMAKKFVTSDFDQNTHFEFYTVANFNREIKFYDFYRFSAKSVRAKIANFFARRDRLDFSSDLNSTAKIRTASFLRSFWAVGRPKTQFYETPYSKPYF